MLEQEMITQEQHDEAETEVPPARTIINQPQPDSEEPYFTTWVTQQAVDKFGADRVFGGGMEIKTTLDPELQAAAEAAVAQISGVGPSASLVTIENATGEVKALVGGENFRDKPFNLATNGHRQPGSAFKPFILLTALDQGNYGPGSVFASQPKEFPFTNKDGVKDVFRVANYEDQYLGSASLTTATAQSDNSIFAELGMKVGRENVAEMATEMGIKTDLSTNPAMLLGGLKEGVTPLEMAFAYSTLANSGKRVCAEWASYKCGPVAIKGVEGEDKPERKTKEVFSQEVADTAKTMLSYVITLGDRYGRAGRRVRGRQDRHDGELRRRLVLRLHRQVHDLRLGRLRRQGAADGDRVRRQPRGRRHVARLDLAVVHVAGDRDPRHARGRGGRRGRRRTTPRRRARARSRPRPRPRRRPRTTAASPRLRPRRSSRRPRTTRRPRPRRRSLRASRHRPRNRHPRPNRPPRAAAAEPGGAAE